MESAKKMLELLVEKTFQKYNVKSNVNSLSDEQKQKLRALVEDIKKETETFLANAEITESTDSRKNKK
ncbi:hypothetical protein [Alteribacter natronophilus]|uniref:hypothetical protein n=1 Tax=Alteribacter natronophilus TaxID=2583810 RepID=UPI00110E8B2F|nr:hypothetical protein [Alteribacter natronophilus]TMW70142.1 hypothetical protein FGB90_18430 [Alteribacter natronophilus]